MKKLFLLCMLVSPLLVASQTRTGPPFQAQFKVLVDGDALIPSFALSFTPSTGGTRFTRKFDNLMDTLTTFDILPRLPAGAYARIARETNRNLIVSAPLSEGEYRVAVTELPANYRVKSFTAGTVDALRFPLLVRRNSTPMSVISFEVSEPASGGRKVSGRVTGMIAEHLESEPRVALSGKRGLFTARADREGNFEFAHIPSGEYTAHMTKRIVGSQPSTKMLVGLQTSPRVRVTASGKDVSGVRIAMPPVKVVIGHVLVEGNAPRPNALKVVVTGAFGRVGGDILSAADGSFRLVLPEGDCSIALDTASLPAGYTLRSWQYGSANLIKNPKIRVAAADTTELQAVMAVTTAQVTMKLPDGSELLARPPEPNVSVTVTGRVTGIEPVSAPWTVYLTGGRTIGDSPSRSQLRRDGAFEFKKVTQGHYDLMGMLNGPTIRVSLRSIDVAEKDLTNVEAAVPHLKTASGRMVVEGNGPMPLAYSFGLDIGKGAPMAVSVVPDCDGSFVARLPEGSHSVSTSLPPQYVKAFTYGAADLLRGTLQVSASDNAELRITLAANTTVGRGLIGSVSMNSSQIFPALDFGPRTCPAPK